MEFLSNQVQRHGYRAHPQRRAQGLGGGFDAAVAAAVGFQSLGWAAVSGPNSETLPRVGGES